MHEKIINRIIALHHYSFVRITRQTLIMIFPIVFIGTMAKMILKTVFKPDGFIYNVAFLDVIPQSVLQIIQFVLTSIGQLTLGILGVYTAYMAAKFTAKLYRRDGKFAGITAILTLLLMSYRYGKMSSSFSLNFYQRLLSGNSLLLVLLLGYGIGQLYRLLTPPKYGENTNSLPLLQERAFSSMGPIIISVIFGVAVAIFLNSNTIYHAWSTSYSSLVGVAQEHRQLWLTLLASIGITTMDWLGLGVPYNSMALMSGESFTANLNYALAHGTPWNVPYKYLGSSLYNSFANFGGDGLILALIVAILLTSNGSYMHRVARWTALPTLFNFNYATMVGLPIVFNPLFFIPFTFLPIVNILLASFAIAIHLIPSTPYPVLQGTPGPLLGFLGTNGNWGTLIFALVLLLLDIIAYIPFVKMALAVERRLMLEEQEVAGHEKNS
ncbi:PTS sugar transporter subunit IIC [Limosilactobacillus caviae]|uniref:PTS cellobiose transporter subunit IIC n=1 Tax=Limosilactobacillus caviae TaxID=1769424 RepID=A0ABQ2C761_9LACO|nr:PTS sugar transporter subunit IIC [Limosilactobacillus caviae]MCD7124305.1 PTS sugar transporter subunit IIC [Limosilactobacillus caviae]MRH46799.1 PTS sugar transporter subunit IIC [Limosilactobacillus reuteri]GGI63945.1 PTS cellobiose transporter subunit IIC [Limosilactobacillus caviae]